MGVGDLTRAFLCRRGRGLRCVADWRGCGLGVDKTAAGAGWAFGVDCGFGVDKTAAGAGWAFDAGETATGFSGFSTFEAAVFFSAGLASADFPSAAFSSTLLEVRRRPPRLFFTGFSAAVSAGFSAAFDGTDANSSCKWANAAAPCASPNSCFIESHSSRGGGPLRAMEGAAQPLGRAVYRGAQALCSSYPLSD